MSSLPLDDRGWHELILRVFEAGDRFCYRYRFDGVERHRAPILHVHAGERFAVRIVNELDGPASGGNMPASALPACSPMSMPDVPIHRYVGYMNHTIEARWGPMKDTDVNVHFHGFEGSPLQDDIFLSTLSTPEHACEYRFTVPLTQPPGTYFYHPHAHGAAGDQVAGGLSGMWIVDPKMPQLPPRDEHAVVIRYRVPFVVDDRFLPKVPLLYLAAAHHESGLEPAPPVRFDPFDPPPWPSSLPIRAQQQHIVGLCGSRSSTELAVDGVDAPGRLTVPAGEPQLLRVLDATSDTAFELRMRDAAGHAYPLQVVGRDGIPVGGDDTRPLAQFISESKAPLVPASRIDLLLTLKPGEVVTLYGAHHCTAPFDEFKLRHDLLVVAAGPPAVHPTVLTSTAVPPDRTPATELVRFARTHPRLIVRRALTYTEYVLPKPNGHGLYGAYFITETSDPHFHEHPFWPTYAKGAQVPAPDIVVKRGSIEEWYLYNATMEVHSFHIHQMAFVDEDAAGGPNTADTVLVPFGKLLADAKSPDYPLVKPSLTRVLIDFRHVPRGTFVFHCHMLFHEDRGMMGIVRVE
ncbi:MAG TPA: multicopper oxidase domain-containing protein [Candidatus Baltobacteraceae bacterium]|nr:multicopper oxidase domain-containing protein [Candidatus Baltobacteraceae bacterium]